MAARLPFNRAAVETTHEAAAGALAGRDYWPKREAVERAIAWLEASRSHRPGEGRLDREMLKDLRAALAMGRCRESTRPDSRKAAT